MNDGAGRSDAPPGAEMGLAYPEATAGPWTRFDHPGAEELSLGPRPRSLSDCLGLSKSLRSRFP
jgi:hypothetical protein